jgi:hypothetical protein
MGRLIIFTAGTFGYYKKGKISQAAIRTAD